MEQKNHSSRVRLVLGLVSLIVGFFASNLALFHWIERTNIYYLLGDYARYICGYSGFAAMILGALLINDFFTFRSLPKEKTKLKKSIFSK